MTPGAIAIRALIIGFIISFAVITGFAYTTLLERKVLARLQHRIGPNRAGYLPEERRALVTAGVGHAISFSTWRSLVREQGLDAVKNLAAESAAALAPAPVAQSTTARSKLASKTPRSLKSKLEPIIKELEACLAIARGHPPVAAEPSAQGRRRA